MRITTQRAARHILERKKPGPKMGSSAASKKKKSPAADEVRSKSSPPKVGPGGAGDKKAAPVAAKKEPKQQPKKKVGKAEEQDAQKSAKKLPVKKAPPVAKSKAVEPKTFPHSDSLENSPLLSIKFKKPKKTLAEDGLAKGPEKKVVINTKPEDLSTKTNNALVHTILNAKSDGPTKKPYKIKKIMEENMNKALKKAANEAKKEKKAKSDAKSPRKKSPAKGDDSNDFGPKDKQPIENHVKKAASKKVDNCAIMNLLKEASKKLAKQEPKKKKPAGDKSKGSAAAKKSGQPAKPKNAESKILREDEMRELNGHVASDLKKTKNHVLKNSRATGKQSKKNDTKKKVAKKPVKKEESSDEMSSSSDEMPLDTLRQQKKAEPAKIIKKERPMSLDSEDKKPAVKVVVKTEPPLKVIALPIKKRGRKKIDTPPQPLSPKPEIKVEEPKRRGRKKKVVIVGGGVKRHRLASLNALAKVHCLYENESRAALMDAGKSGSSSYGKGSEVVAVEAASTSSTRTLRSVPGLRGAGKHWDMSDTSLTSSNDDSDDSETSAPPPPQKKRKSAGKNADTNKDPKKKKRRKRTELIMDLKDMVVRKRMASLNASAILAASYSMEKRQVKSPKDEDSDSDDTDDSSVDLKHKKDSKKSGGKDRKVIEVRASPNKKVAVIVNQDTDVTITGVYVNSTTRSTHHEGYCSIAGMQYRISATSHTQTAATTVAAETLLHTAANAATDHAGGEQSLVAAPCKSYTPLGALSNMNPPGHAPPPISPMGRRHGCPSAFTAPPPTYGPPHPPPHHHPPPPPSEHQPPPGYIHGYYQPAGPLITAHHGHSHVPPPSGKSVSLPTLEASPSPTPPPSHQPPAGSTGDSSDNEVIITAASSGTDSTSSAPPPAPHQQAYRYSQFPPGPHGYSYTYPPSQYYHPPPASGYPPQQHYHHELCYPPATGYPPAAAYLHPKAYPYRRYLMPPPPQYYHHQASSELYAAGPPAPQPPGTAPGAGGQVVSVASSTAGASGSVATYQPAPQQQTGPPPPTLVEAYPPPQSAVPPTIVEQYAPQPPPHYYAAYGPGPAGPPCYTHQPPTRSLAFIDPAYQSCPCPMQSCPKNVHTGPLTGDGKRSNVTAIAKESVPLPPVALALPLEPASATGPPSPARGSAGMPPPPSPAGATYQPPPPTPKWDAKGAECGVGGGAPITATASSTASELLLPADTKRRKARVGKTMARNNITNHFNNIASQLHHQQQQQQQQQLPPQPEQPPEPQQPLSLPGSAPPAGNTTMLLMCHNPLPPIVAESEVKREVQSPVEKEEAAAEAPAEQTRLAEEPPDQVDCSKSESDRAQPDPPLQTVPVRRKSLDAKTLPAKEKKRKAPPEDEPPKEQEKKQKVLEKAKQPNGSYKNLIKKDAKMFKINTPAKGKANSDSDDSLAEKKLLLTKTGAGKVKKPAKRKSITALTDEDAEKRPKNSKPLSLHNSKQNQKSNKEKQPAAVNSELSENKEPTAAKKKGQSAVNSKCMKKFAPEVLDNLFTKNNVDRTIESVVSSAVFNNNNRTKPNGGLDVLCAKDPHVAAVVLAVDKKPPPPVTNNGKVVPRVGASKRKTKSRSVEAVVPMAVPRVPRKSLQQSPRWSNGWSWEGEPFEGKVFLNSDEATVLRKCYPCMRHMEGDKISPKDCVLLKAGARKIDLPFVAKVAALWENPDDGEMMMSLLWYYRPEHTDQGRRPTDQPDEVFASRHKDTNSVACIEDKCYVLTFNEYCRYRKTLRRLEEGLEDVSSIVPTPEGGPYYRIHRQPPSPLSLSPDMVFFCRKVYDFRQKRIVRNPS